MFRVLHNLHFLLKNVGNMHEIIQNIWTETFHTVLPRGHGASRDNISARLNNFRRLFLKAECLTLLSIKKTLIADFLLFIGNRFQVEYNQSSDFKDFMKTA